MYLGVEMILAALLPRLATPVRMYAAIKAQPTHAPPQWGVRLARLRTGKRKEAKAT
jgi:hypothetical protein